MNPNTPYTRQQWNLLNKEEQQAVDAVSVYLHGVSLPRDELLTDSAISTSLRLLQPTDEAYVPDEENDGDITQAIQKKFHAIYHAGITLAETILNRQGKKPTQDFNFLLVVEMDAHDTTHVVVVDWDAPSRYLHEWTDAMDFQFANLNAIAAKVLAVRNLLVNEVVNPQPILVVVECGIFKEAHDIPRGFEVHCLDYDVEHLPPEKLEISPIDGEACTITRFTP
ncbi:MAG: hypothetical protein RIS56_1488 [Verrucomicrobiota bacterium]|jgi:hypothetical protein